MGKIIFLMGKSASGKDTVYQTLLQLPLFDLHTVVPYTTRPMRSGEVEGKEYHFVTQEKLQQMHRAGKVIEVRTYETTQGPWSYFTADDGQIDLAKQNYLMIGTLESFSGICRYFGKENVLPVYLALDEGERLTRAVKRERLQPNPDYAEVCRRYLADEADFSEEKLAAAGITRKFFHMNTQKCVAEICAYLETNADER